MDLEVFRSLVENWRLVQSGEVFLVSPSPPMKTGPRCGDALSTLPGGEANSSDLSDSLKDASKASF